MSGNLFFNPNYILDISAERTYDNVLLGFPIAAVVILSTDGIRERYLVLVSSLPR